MRRVRLGFLLLALAASGLYLFVYLYRWEWHRALVAGVIFVAAEVGLAAATILERLRSIEARLDAGAGAPAAAATATPAVTPAAAPVPETLERLRESAPGPRTNFEWLSRQQGQVSVFVPLLLGAGVVLSALAWVVERVARVTARPTMERGLALRLVPVGFPAGVFAGAPAPPAPRRRPLVVHLLAVVAAIGVATIGLDAMADATQNRPDPRSPDSVTSMVLHVSARPERPTVGLATDLWGACVSQLGGVRRSLDVTDLGLGEVHLVVRPGIGKYAERRLRGCISDATTDRVSAHIRSVTTQ